MNELSLHVVHSFQEIQINEPSPSSRVGGDFLEEAVCNHSLPEENSSRHPLEGVDRAGRKVCNPGRRKSLSEVLLAKENMSIILIALQLP